MAAPSQDDLIDNEDRHKTPKFQSSSAKVESGLLYSVNSLASGRWIEQLFQSCSAFRCPIPTGNFPMIESESCEVYWQCSNGFLVAAQCAGAHQFHYKERKCLHGSIVSCIMQRKQYKQAHMSHKAMPHKPMPMPMPMPMTPKPRPPKPIYIPFPVPVHPQHPVPPCAAPPCGKPIPVPASPPCDIPSCGKPVAVPGKPGLIPFPQNGQIPPYIVQMWRNVFGRG